MAPRLAMSTSPIASAVLLPVWPGPAALTALTISLVLPCRPVTLGLARTSCPKQPVDMTRDAHIRRAMTRDS